MDLCNGVQSGWNLVKHPEENKLQRIDSSTAIHHLYRLVLQVDFTSLEFIIVIYAQDYGEPQ